MCSRCQKVALAAWRSRLAGRYITGFTGPNGLGHCPPVRNSHLTGNSGRGRQAMTSADRFQRFPSPLPPLMPPHPPLPFPLTYVVDQEMMGIEGELARQSTVGNRASGVRGSP
ncbi:unnamed protein product [Danaus chrysippus]|uniref:(African queen) hypothetical protein n=1 Tax=Danaus chrysippus TaxID=151541 RepID=A0A8J2QQQ1_9NEOP|nr:unnamed protein product [Danaus chrysippus]